MIFRAKRYSIHERLGSEIRNRRISGSEKLRTVMNPYFMFHEVYKKKNTQKKTPSNNNGSPGRPARTFLGPYRSKSRRKTLCSDALFRSGIAVQSGKLRSFVISNRSTAAVTFSKPRYYEYDTPETPLCYTVAVANTHCVSVVTLISINAMDPIPPIPVGS